MKTIYLFILRWLQSKCQHPSYAVKADILQGDVRSHRVQWCECCGAFRFMSTKQVYSTEEWRNPRPDYYTPKERKDFLNALVESK
jgi:hypothetical protein